MENVLKPNTTYAAIVFDWVFNTSNGLCPYEYEQQYLSFRKRLARDFHCLTNNVLISKANNDGIIRSALEFKGLMKDYPMFSSNVVRIKTFSLITLQYQDELNKICM